MEGFCPEFERKWTNCLPRIEILCFCFNIGDVCATETRLWRSIKDHAVALEAPVTLNSILVPTGPHFST